MNVAKIKKFDIANGPGIRTSLYVSGCTHHCKHCFQPETWSFDYGYEYTKETQIEIIESLKDKQGLSLLGGDPFDNVCNDMLELLSKFKQTYNDKDVWCWTGYLFEDILKDKDKIQLLKYIDVLVDGPFVQELKDLKLKFKGSNNQRVIDVKQSLLQDKVIILEKHNN